MNDTKQLFTAIMNEKHRVLALGVSLTNWKQMRYKMKRGVYISEAYMEDLLIKAGYKKEVTWVPPDVNK